MKYFNTYICTFLVLASVLVSCREDVDCSKTGRPIMNAKIYSQDLLGEMKQVAIRQITVKAKTMVSGQEKDTLIINAQTNAKDLLLPLSFTKNIEEFIFVCPTQVEGSEGLQTVLLEDKVTVKHTNTPYLISPDCGFQVIQRLDSIAVSTHNFIDSIKIANNDINVNGEENIKIYIKYMPTK